MSFACPDSPRFRGLAAVLLAFALTAPPGAAAGRVLRVAADPNNLPFSNERGEGFENRIAELLAAELGARLEYMWWPQRRGFFRETLGSGRADVVIGVPAGFELTLNTRPYYTSTYVFVRPLSLAPVTSLEDPRLASLRIGVQVAGDDGANTPAAQVLAARGLANNLRGYTLYGDYSQPSPPSAIIRGVARGEVDLAVAWGPLAGYFAPRQSRPLAIEPVAPCDCPTLKAIPFVFSIALGVARGRDDLREELDAILVRRRGDIERILDEYGVPRATPPRVAQRPKEVRHASR